MTFPGRVMTQGTFTVPSTLPASINVNLGYVPTKVELFDMNTITSMAGGPPVVNPGATLLIFRAVWQSAFASAATPFTLVEGLTASANTDAIAPITSNGISTYDYHNASPNSNLLSASLGGGGTTINQNANATFTTTSPHGLQVGDTILITNNAKMTNIGGMQFTVVAVPTTSTFQVDLNTSNATAFPAAETSYVVRKVLVGPLYYPQSIFITNITAAGSMVISTSQNHGLTVGQQVRLRVPSVWGMTQANNLTGIITAVTNATASVAASITIGGINSSAFSAFVFAPPSKVPFSYAQVIPMGAGPSSVTFGNVTYNVDGLDDATLNQGFQGFTVGTGILATASGTVFGVTAGDVIAWTAWRADQ